jgi:TonB family protein
MSQTALIPVFLAIAAAGASVVVADVAEAESAFARGDYREAYRQARASIQADPSDARARLLAGMAGLRLVDDRPRVDLDEIEKHFRVVLDIAPDTPGIRYLLGVTLFQEAESLPRRRKRARALYGEAAQLFADELERETPNRTGALEGRAVALGRAGRFDESIEAHEVWIAADPSNQAAYLSAIRLAVDGRLSDESVALLKRAFVALDQELPGLFEVGLECASEDDMMEVVGAIRDTVETPWQRAALEILYFRDSGRLDLAASALEEFVASEPPEWVKKELSARFERDFAKGSPFPAFRENDSRLGNPRRVNYVRPAYPERARGPRVEATVIAVGIIRRDGKTELFWAHSSRSGLGFEKAALDAVRLWEYEPGTLDGQPADFLFTVRVDFSVGSGNP